jgi:hypothetical protein
VLHEPSIVRYRFGGRDYTRYDTGGRLTTSLTALVFNDERKIVNDPGKEARLAQLRLAHYCPRAARLLFVRLNLPGSSINHGGDQNRYHGTAGSARKESQD